MTSGVTPAGSFDAVVLAGGRGQRLGGASKPEVLVAGRTLLDRALDATLEARRTVVVGPPHLARPGVPTVLEDPPSGGPVAGIDAGLTALGLHADDDDVPVLVLACDVPRAAAAVPVLVAALLADAGADGAHLVRAGRAQLVAVHHRRSLRSALDGLAADGELRGASVRRLLDRLRMVPVPDPEGLADDADTWDDVARLETLLSGQAPLPAPPALAVPTPFARRSPEGTR
jgi:molybdopterin-guanine dinucleotide biosynthesis protein A